MARIENILIIGSVCKGAIENFFSKGFELQGAKVTTYAIADNYSAAISKSVVNRAINKVSPGIFYRPLNRQLLSFLKRKTFDVILVFKGMELLPETVRELKEHARVLANYNCDHPFRFYSPGAGNNNVLDSIPYYDVHFSYAKRIVEQLRSNFHKEAQCIPFGFDSETDPRTVRSALDCNGRFLFIGAYDQERAGYLDELKHDKLEIYGNTKWKTRNSLKPYILKVYQHREIFGNEYISAIHTCWGVINLLRMQNLKENSHNMRTFEVPGYAGLLLSQRTEEQMEYFEADKEAIYFSGIDELRDKMSFLENNQHLINGIKAAAYERSIKSKYSYNDRSAQMFNWLQSYFNQ